jgi:hypothetical protein
LIEGKELLQIGPQHPVKNQKLVKTDEAEHLQIQEEMAIHHVHSVEMMKVLHVPIKGKPQLLQTGRLLEIKEPGISLEMMVQIVEIQTVRINSMTEKTSPIVGMMKREHLLQAAMIKAHSPDLRKPAVPL